jgi:hypothetical protein
MHHNLFNAVTGKDFSKQLPSAQEKIKSRTKTRKARLLQVASTTNYL